MSNMNEPEMRSYLLGGLSPERRAELKALVAADANLQEELLAIKEELFDEYLAGCLSTEEKQSFETQLLTAEKDQQDLHFAQLFEAYRNSHPAAEPQPVHRVPAPNIPPVPASSPLIATFYKNPAFAVMAIVVAGLLVTLLGWMVVMRSPASNDVAGPSSRMVFQLTPGSTRSGGAIQYVRAPAKDVEVKLELQLAKSDFKKYKTQLFRENQALASQEELKTESRSTHYVVPVTVTGEILTPGDYQLKLSGVLDSGQPSFIDSYRFRVTVQDSTDSDLPRDQQAR
jgi:hypothetical protein